MRKLVCASMVMTLLGCSTVPSTMPREYLDEDTAATITVVAQPWIFTSARVRAQPDYVHLYGVDVNRTGEHRHYLAVVQYWLAPEHNLLTAPKPDLEITFDGEIATLSLLQQELRSLGIGTPLDARAPKGSRTWLYPVSVELVQRIAQAQSVSVALIAEGRRVPYQVWRDGRAELNEFARLAAD